AGRRQRQDREALGPGIEADERVAAEVGQPDDVAIVDVDGVRLRGGAGELPLAPRLARGVVHADLAGVPLADPDAAARVRPDAPGALARRRRLEPRRTAGADVDARDMAAGERGVVDVAAG